MLSLFDGDYCKECLKKQPLHIKFEESLKNENWKTKDFEWFWK